MPPLSLLSSALLLPALAVLSLLLTPLLPWPDVALSDGLSPEHFASPQTAEAALLGRNWSGGSEDGPEAEKEGEGAGEVHFRVCKEIYVVCACG